MPSCFLQALVTDTAALSASPGQRVTSPGPQATGPMSLRELARQQRPWSRGRITHVTLDLRPCHSKAISRPGWATPTRLQEAWIPQGESGTYFPYVLIPRLLAFITAFIYGFIITLLQSSLFIGASRCSKCFTESLEATHEAGTAVMIPVLQRRQRRLRQVAELARDTAGAGLEPRQPGSKPQLSPSPAALPLLQLPEFSSVSPTLSFARTGSPAVLLFTFPSGTIGIMPRSSVKICT